MTGPLRLYRVPALNRVRLVLELDGKHYQVPPEHEPPNTRADVLRGFIKDDGLVECEAPTGELLPAVDPARVAKILCLGKNFHAHAAEFGEEVPKDPLFFNKLPETLVGHGSQVRVPATYSDRYDHEAELVVVIGTQGCDITPEDAHAHIAGYTIANDLTARTLQKADREIGFPWFRAKNFPGSCPLGPCFLQASELDPTDLAITCHVNGELRQDSRTSLMVISIERAIAHLSTYFELYPGDLILMGTPAGVGPLEDGDQVSCTIEGIGELNSTIRR